MILFILVIRAILSPPVDRVMFIHAADGAYIYIYLGYTHVENMTVRQEDLAITIMIM